MRARDEQRKEEEAKRAFKRRKHGTQLGETWRIWERSSYISSKILKVSAIWEGKSRFKT